MRIPNILAAALLATAAIPVGAVTVTGMSAGGGNAVTVQTAGAGLLEADFTIRASSPVRLDLLRDSGEEGFRFNSMVDIFTAVESGRNVRWLSLFLTGATFGQPGGVAPGFVGHSTSLNTEGTLFTITLDLPGEPNGIALGSLAGGQDFGIVFNDRSNSASLSIQAGVPEPASWALMICGFLVAGTMLRKARPTLNARATASPSL